MPTLPGFDLSESPVSPAMLDGAELVLGISFPDTFRTIACQYDGASGSAAFPVPGVQNLSGIGSWLSYRPWLPQSVWFWLSNWSEHELPNTVVPFAEDGGGNLMCLDYRAGPIPSVARWFHELSGADGLFTVAESFEQWLETVVPDPEDEV